MEKGYIEMKGVFETMRKLDKCKINEILEGEQKEKPDPSVPYTSNDELMTSIMETTKAQFGADYEGQEGPMLYYPNDGDVVLSGKVPSLNDLKFQFRYKDQNGGCYIWSSPLTLNKDTISTLSKIFGVFDNWKNELETTEDIKPMSFKNNQM